MKRLEKFRKEQKRLEKIAEEREIAATAADSYTLLLAKLDRLVNTYENINRLEKL